MIPGAADPYEKSFKAVANHGAERNLGYEESLHQISGDATAAVIPGAADPYEKSFKAVANHGAQELQTRMRSPSRLWKTTVLRTWVELPGRVRWSELLPAS